MRRTLAGLVLVFISFPLIVPALALNADTQLPSCCRRDGKHHCAMVAGDAEQGTAIQAIRTKCPYFPAAHTAYRGERDFAVLHICRSPFALVRSIPFVPTARDRGKRTPVGLAHSKRGPPSLIS